MHEKNRRVWSAEDKKRAVELSLRTSLSEAAEELGCSIGSLRKWTREQKFVAKGIPRRPGRPAVYDDLITPNLAAIAGMARRGATKKEIKSSSGLSKRGLMGDQAKEKAVKAHGGRPTNETDTGATS
jgi:transposase-like protein